MRVEGLGSTFQLPVKKGANDGFVELLKKFISDVNSDLKSAEEAEKQIVEGKVSNLEELMYRIERSDISLRLLVEIRNKAIEAYHEIMRMQI